MKTFKCDYAPNGTCPYIDSSGNTRIICSECDHFSTRIRSTGGMPILDWLINLFKHK